jgi:hypothetical protein
METTINSNNLFKPYTKADLPALQVYVPQLMDTAVGVPDVPGVSVREVRQGKGQAHKHCQLISIDSGAGPITVCVTETPWETQIVIRIGGLGFDCPPQFIQRLINPTVGQLIRAICNYVQRCLDAANDADGGQWAA